MPNGSDNSDTATESIIGSADTEISISCSRPRTVTVAAAAAAVAVLSSFNDFLEGRCDENE